MQIKACTSIKPFKRKLKPSHRNNGVCLATFSDLSQQISIGVSAISCGSPDPHSDDFCALAYLSSSLLSKHPALSGGVDAETRRTLAIAKLRRANDTCSHINEFGYRDHIDPSILASILFTAKNLIGNLLHGYEYKCLQGVGFSNGASQGFKRQDGAPYKKFAGKATVTRSALPLAIAVVKQSVSWEEALTRRFGSEANWFTIVYGNGLFTVPKNNLIDRAACKEPCMNMYLQRGAGLFIRNRLRTVGIDLNDQTRNNRLAQLGSLDGSLATIDLSSASDSISDRLVWDLLPPELYSYLDSLRSKRIANKGNPQESWKHELFSTMGNGFTFELESLLFWALAKSCTLYLNSPCDNIGIYGDDIIIPTNVFPLLHDILSAVGFSLNTEKSFYTGYFRESCGKHYYRGTDVTPFYIKQPIVNSERLMLVLNRLRAWGVVSGISDPRLYEVWSEYSKYVPTMFYGGQNLDTGYSLVTRDCPRKELRPISVKKKFFDTWEQYGRLCASLSEPEPLSSDQSFQYFIGWKDWKSLLRWSLRAPNSVKSAIEDTRVITGYAIKRNRSWMVPVPVFPQEILGTATLTSEGYGLKA